MTEFYAQPYSIEHQGFYFDSIESYERGMESLNKRGCEEVEIQFIDGEDHHCRMASALGASHMDIDAWFIHLEDCDAVNADQICFLFDLGYDLDNALSSYQDVNTYGGSAADYAYELIQDTSEVPEHLENYIDYDAIARDMLLGGEIIELRSDCIVTNALEF